jgi:hypothetical protein
LAACCRRSSRKCARSTKTTGRLYPIQCSGKCISTRNPGTVTTAPYRGSGNWKSSSGSSSGRSSRSADAHLTTVEALIRPRRGCGTYRLTRNASTARNALSSNTFTDSYRAIRRRHATARRLRGSRRGCGRRGGCGDSRSRFYGCEGAVRTCRSRHAGTFVVEHSVRFYFWIPIPICIDPHIGRNCWA